MPVSLPNPDAKTALRQTLRAQRNALSAAQRREFSARIVAQLRNWLLSMDNPRATIALYEATPREADLSALCALPFDFVLPRRVDSGWIDAGDAEPLERKDALQVLAPSQIDIFLIPGLGFDTHGQRIGQGGGWYDRVLARAPHALKIGVAFECQILSRVPREAHDVKMDGVVTENGWCKYLQR